MVVKGLSKGFFLTILLIVTLAFLMFCNLTIHPFCGRLFWP